MKIWSCKIGECDAEVLPEGADAPMRAAVERAYRELTGFDAAFNFSGWGAELDESERAVVENREPSEEHHRAWQIQQAAPDLYEALSNVNKLISEAAMTGFNWQDGDWAERLFFSQQATSSALHKARGDGPKPIGTPQDTQS